MNCSLIFDFFIRNGSTVVKYKADFESQYDLNKAKNTQRDEVVRRLAKRGLFTKAEHVTGLSESTSDSSGNTAGTSTTEMTKTADGESNTTAAPTSPETKQNSITQEETNTTAADVTSNTPTASSQSNTTHTMTEDPNKQTDTTEAQTTTPRMVTASDNTTITNEPNATMTATETLSTTPDQ